MISLCCAVLASVSVLDHPSLQQRHEECKARMLRSIRASDAFGMRLACMDALESFPGDPVWNYNLACAYAKGGKVDKALKTLEKAVRSGYRDSRAMANDPDLKPISKTKEFHALLDLADELRDLPPANAPVAARKVSPDSIIVGERNLAWDFDNACFVAKMDLGGVDGGGNAGDLYLNRDRGHSALPVKEYPGIVSVRMGSEVRGRNLDVDFPNTAFPYPVFGNCSRALVTGPYWRSLPRAMVTSQAFRLKAMSHFYLTNQIWVFPVVNDCPPLGKHGDVFASQTPYWIATQGRSWSDQYYLKAALEISRSLKPEVKREIVLRGLLAPTVQSIIRRSLKGVKDDEDYLTSSAHPTAFPADGLDMAKLKSSAAALTKEAIPPVAVIKGVAIGQSESGLKTDGMPELSYVSPCAWAFVLRRSESRRTFILGVSGADEYVFSVVHGAAGAAKVEKIAPDAAKITLDKNLITQSNRVDVAVFGKTAKSGWGAPSFVSFAVLDPNASYCDPVLLGVRGEDGKSK